VELYLGLRSSSVGEWLQWWSQNFLLSETNIPEEPPISLLLVSGIGKNTVAIREY